MTLSGAQHPGHEAQPVGDEAESASGGDQHTGGEAHATGRENESTGRGNYGQFPLRSHLGLDMAVTGPGAASASVTADQRHLNPNGVVHGAVLFALADTAMGAAAMTVVPDGSFCASVEVHVRFLQPALAGHLGCEVTVERAGKRIVHLSGRINDANGATVATATGTFAVITPPQS